MIKIINGTYGYRDGKRVVPKTAGSPPFSLDPEREKQLVAEGVAEFVEAKEEEKPQEPDKEPDKIPADKEPGDNSEDPKEPAADTDEDLPEYNENMKLTELKEIAQAYGVDAEKARSKAEVIAMIDASLEEAAEDDGEEPPTFEAEPPVE